MTCTTAKQRTLKRSQRLVEFKNLPEQKKRRKQMTFGAWFWLVYFSIATGAVLGVIIAGCISEYLKH
jgi:hypothetical protein